MLKFFIGAITWLFIPAMAIAQSTEDARQMIYYTKYNTAAESLHHLLHNEPLNADAWYLLSQAYIATGRLKEIRETMQKVPEALKDNPMIRSAWVHILLKENDSVAAKPIIEAVLKDTKMKKPAVLGAIANALVDAKSGDAHYAITLLHKAIKRDKNNPALDIIMGDAYRKLMDGGNAYTAYKHALEKNDRYAVAEYKIGKIYTSQKNEFQYLPAFEQAVSLDPLYSPALYELYYHYYYKDIHRAKDYLEKYIAAAEYNIQNDYLYTDMLYASKKYSEAIQSADALIKKSGEAVQPRLYKLEAFSHQELGDSLKAVQYMNAYFKAQPDSGIMAKDYEVTGDIYAGLQGKEDSAAYYYTKGAELEQDSLAKAGYYKKISGLYKQQKDYANEALWLGKYYSFKPNGSNVDLFNWGLATYLAKDFHAADTIFAMYAHKYPAEEYGYYWRARSNAAIDTAMEMGLAVPHYTDLIARIENDTANEVSKKHLVEAYGYIAAYKANAEKDYEASVGYFEKLLVLDPDNADAKRYVEILKKNLAKNEQGSGTKQ